MKKTFVYYNEFDPKAAAWLRQLIKEKRIPEGEVDERSIVDVQPSDLRGFVQHHFFAGIGGWVLALLLAGVPADLICATASLPCQPWSDAGKGEGKDDDRHLFPVFYQLVIAMRWPLIFGEQVASAAVVGPVHRPDRLPVRGEESEVWYSGVRNELEQASYTVGALDLPAPSIGARCEVGVLRGDTFAWEPGRIGPNHIRQRLFWCAWLADARRGLHERGLRPLEAFGAAGAAQGEGHQRQWSWDDFRGRGGDVHRGTPDTGGPQCEGWTFSQPEGDPGQRGRVLVPAHHGSNDGGDADSHGQQRQGCRGEGRGRSESPDHRGLEHGERAGLEGHAGDVFDRDQSGRIGQGAQRPVAPASGTGDSEPSDANGGDASEGGQQRGREHGLIAADDNLGFWLNSSLIACTDGKARRIESGTFPLAHGIPRGVVPSGDPGDESYANATGESRTARLRAYGNAIVPQLAAEFIQTCLEVISE